ncbi:MAG: WD40/YVTN/BNR-like repeat-containing protein [bacterium]
MKIKFTYILILFSFLLSPILFSEQWYIYDHNLTKENLNSYGGSNIDIRGNYIVGNKGKVLHLDFPITYNPYDPKWDDTSPPTNENLYGVDYNKVYAYVVGANGTIIYYYSSDWHFINSPSSNNLYSVTLSVDSYSGFVVGEGGTILYGGGKSPSWYVYDKSPTINNLYSVSGIHNYPNTTWAVGANGTILDYENGNWSLYNSFPTSQDLFCVCVIDSIGYDYAYACGANGTILVKEGDKWVKVNSNTTENLYSIWGRIYQSEPEIFCVGANGTIIYSKGGYYWQKEECPVNFDLHGVGGFGKFVFACGNNGTILYRGKVLSITPESIGIIKSIFSEPTIQSSTSKIE